MKIKKGEVVLESGIIALSPITLYNKNGIVQLSGGIRQNSVPLIQSWSAGKILTIPDGFKPLTEVRGKYFNCDSENGETDKDFSLWIDTNGNVSIGARGGKVDWKSLSNGNEMRFSVVFIAA